ncbi:MAG: septum site-determining protein MinC [Enterobacteriaceae bacterium]
MIQSPIELKGSNFTLSVIQLNQASPETIRLALLEKIQQAPAFLRNAPVVLNVSKLSADANWPAIKQAVEQTGLHVVGVSGWQQQDELKQAVVAAGFPLLNEGNRQKQSATPVAEPVITRSKIVSTPIRSGQQIYARNSDLIVLAHVSAGAELVADGNIHIYGVMRGRALAGASGDGESQIFCTQLNAELVSIAGQYWLSDQIPAPFYGSACRICWRDNVLSIEPL